MKSAAPWEAARRRAAISAALAMYLDSTRIGQISVAVADETPRPEPAAAAPARRPAPSPAPVMHKAASLTPWKRMTWQRMRGAAAAQDTWRTR